MRPLMLKPFHRRKYLFILLGARLFYLRRHFYSKFIRVLPRAGCTRQTRLSVSIICRADSTRRGRIWVRLLTAAKSVFSFKKKKKKKKRRLFRFADEFIFLRFLFFIFSSLGRRRSKVFCDSRPRWVGGVESVQSCPPRIFYPRAFFLIGHSLVFF